MPYEKTATRRTPALIIYLVDLSGSMNNSINGVSKAELVTEALLTAVREMVRRSTKGMTPSARYRVAMFTYNQTVDDVFGGPIAITDVIKRGIPHELNPNAVTDTAMAFHAAEELLIAERAELRDCPAPLICHFTDGSYTGTDPKPIVERIKQMSFPDGAVLVENIFFDTGALRDSIKDVYEWPGIVSPDELVTTAARELFEMSSPIPESYLALFAERGYRIRPEGRLLFPGQTPEMLEAAFTMSGMTRLQ